MRHHVIGVVAHQSRHDHAEHLAGLVDAVTVSEDDGTLGHNRNHLLVWSRLAKHDAEWAVCLEDDALPVEGFTGYLSNALTYAPTPIVSCYLGRSRPPHWQTRIGDATAKATANDAAWVTCTHLLFAVGVAIRTELVPGMLHHIERKRYLPADEAISQWCRSIPQPVAYTWPSLVDHNDTLPTLIKHRDGQRRQPGRTAWQTGVRDSYDTTAVAM